MIGNIKDLIKAKLINVEHEIPDNIINMAIEESIDMINTYCNLNEVTTQLKFILANISVDIIVNKYIKNDEVVESIQQGDTKISFVNSKRIRSTDEILIKYKKELNRFRRLKK